MRKSNLLLLLSTATITLSVIFMAACHKSPAATDTGFSTDQATADKSFEDAQTAADQASTTLNGSMTFRTTATTGSPCAEITHTVSASGDSVIDINFGTSDCTCLDGRTRRGEIIVTYTGRYRDAGTVITITFNNYFQNDNQVMGTKTVTNMGTNASGQTYFNVTVSGSVVLASGKGTILETANRVRTWTSQGNPEVYSVYTQPSPAINTITRANGNVIGVDIPSATPLVFSSDCKFIEAGTVTYTLANGKTASMDYGATPNCSGSAILTYNGKTYDITLP